MADLVCKQTRAVCFYFGDIRSVSCLCVQPMWYIFNKNGWKQDVNLDTMSFHGVITPRLFERFSIWTVNYLKKYLYIRGKSTERSINDLAARQKLWYFILRREFRFIIFFIFFHLSIDRIIANIMIYKLWVYFYNIFPSFGAYVAWCDNVANISR